MPRREVRVSGSREAAVRRTPSRSAARERESPAEGGASAEISMGGKGGDEEGPSGTGRRREAQLRRALPSAEPSMEGEKEEERVAAAAAWAWAWASPEGGAVAAPLISATLE